MAGNQQHNSSEGQLTVNITGKPISCGSARGFVQHGHLRQQWQTNLSHRARAEQGGGWGTLTAWELMALVWVPAKDHTPVEELQFSNSLDSFNVSVCTLTNAKGFLSKQIFFKLHYQVLTYAKTEGGFAEIQRRILLLNRFAAFLVLRQLLSV